MTKTTVSFLRWTGGKDWLWKSIEPFITEDESDTYVEPFLGGGAIAIHYLEYCRYHKIKKKFILSDANPGLINAYRYLQSDVEGVIHELRKHESEVEDYDQAYYLNRHRYNVAECPSLSKAALFIWLNAYCWRGLYAINLNGVMSTVPPHFEAAASCFLSSAF